MDFLLGIPDLSETKKKEFMNRLFLNGQLDAIKLCEACEAINELKSHDTFPAVEKFDINDDYGNKSSEKAMKSLKNAFKDDPTIRDLFNFTKENGKERLVLADKSEEETFLYTVASILQEIQESPLEENASSHFTVEKAQGSKQEAVGDEKKRSVDSSPAPNGEEVIIQVAIRDEKEEFSNLSPSIDEEAQGSLERVSVHDKEKEFGNSSPAQVSVQESPSAISTNMSTLEENNTSLATDEEAQVLEQVTMEDKKSIEAQGSEQIEEVKGLSNFTAATDEEAQGSEQVSKKPETTAPFSSMVTPKERKWFQEFAPYIVGKARSINRAINVYNLARQVADKLVVNSDERFRRKLMKLIILAEFWPCRTAFLMQVAVSTLIQCVWLCIIIHLL